MGLQDENGELSPSETSSVKPKKNSRRRKRKVPPKDSSEKTAPPKLSVRINQEKSNDISVKRDAPNRSENIDSSKKIVHQPSTLPVQPTALSSEALKKVMINSNVQLEKAPVQSKLKIQTSKVATEGPALKSELNKIISTTNSTDSLNLLDSLLKMYEQMDGSASKLTEQIKIIAESGMDISESSSPVKPSALSGETKSEKKPEMKDEIEEKFCSSCNKIAETRCTGCRFVFYCSRECQKRDWPQHKDMCRPYTISKRKGIGRLLIASRDIPTEDVILKESPIILGPKQATEPICLGCYREVNGSYRCSKCSWPLCSERCEEKSYHKFECDITKKAHLRIEVERYDFPQCIYNSVILLRLLAYRSQEPDKWASLVERLNNRFIGHNYKGSEEEEIIKILKEDFCENYPEVEIAKMIGLLQTSRVSTKLPYSEVDGLYQTASLISHSCVPNTRFMWDDSEKQLIVKASETIKKGDPITTIQTDILWGTRARRDHLRQGRFISCSCKRCIDPTESGTYFSSLLCQKCLPKKSALVSSDPLDDTATWKCITCSNEMESSDVHKLNLELGAQVSEILINPSIQTSEVLLQKWATLVHTNHYHLHAVKHSLLQMYGRKEDKIEEKSEAHYEELQKKEKACKEFLNVCSLIDPSLAYITSYIGLTFFEYHKPILQNAKQAFGLGKLTTEQLKKRMYLAKALLKKAMEMFKNEPRDTPEGQLFITCKEEFVSIGTWMCAVGLA